MIDLSEIPTELLKQELDKRKAAAKEQKEKEKYERKCCKNCAYRIYGKTFFKGSILSETWVCKKHPKKIISIFNNVPEYNRAYYSCNYFKNKDCKMFIHKDSEKGKKIVKKYMRASFRVID